MNNVNLNLDLKGEYSYQVIDNGLVVEESDWSTNTILSGGLIDLYTYDIPSLLNYLDFGKSGNFIGKAGYFLNGVEETTGDSRLSSVKASTSESYVENVSTKVYYRSFTTLPSTSNATIREFAIKRSQSSNAFARNTFLTPLNIKAGQYIIFYYRLKIDWSSILNYRLTINTGDNYDYSIPVDGATYQIPYDRTYYNNNSLILSQTTEDIPNFGEIFPTNLTYGINNRVSSSFKPTELGYSIDHTTKSVTVNTSYVNVSASSVGIFKNIRCIYLSKDGSVDPSSNFFVSRFKFPLAIYNLDADTTASIQLTYSINTNSGPIGPYSDPYAPSGKRTNYFTFNVNYTWREA
jgi:hypothetical protein